MTVYFTASIVGKKYYLSEYLQVIDYLRKKGYEVLSDHIIKTTEEEIRFEKKEERISFHEKLDKWINSCDFMIAEGSFPSISVGYEVSLALSRNKPVLFLQTDGSKPPSLIKDNKNERLVFDNYTKETLGGVIDDFVNYIEGSNDTRFTFYITPEISQFLEKMAKQERVPKAVYLRKLIQNTILLRK